MNIRIYVVEDHDLMREMINDFLMLEPDFDVCGSSRTGEEALEALADLEADLVLIDVSLPRMSGIDLVAAVRRRWPSQRCMMLSGHGEAMYVGRALAAGAQGYVVKGNPDELLEAIRHVIVGEVYLSERWRGLL